MTLLTISEAAAALRVSKRTMEEITGRGGIEVVRIRGRVLIRSEAIDAYIKAHIEPAVTSIRRRRSA